jgi:hypothetical protein
MRQLVDQYDGRVALDGRVEIEFPDLRSAVVDDPAAGGSPVLEQAAVSARPCVSTTPTTTSTPSACFSRAASSIA